MSVAAGKLDHLMRLWAPVNGRDAAGGRRSKLEERGTIWCERLPQSGNIVSAAAAERGAERIDFRTHTYAAIAAGWQLENERGTRYEVTYPRPTSDPAMMVLETESLEGRV